MVLYINYSFDSSVTSLPTTERNEYEAAVEAACQYYEHVFTSPNEITVNIAFGWGEYGGNPLTSTTNNVLSENVETGVFESYTTIKNALSNRAFALALSGTDPGDSITSANTLPSSDPAPGGNGTYFVTNAEAKALGLTPSYSTTNSQHYDGFVGLNSSDSFTFDPNKRAAAGQYDAIGALEHEISEVLGRIDEMGQTGITVDGNAEQNHNGWYSPLDLFHYDSSGVRSMDLGGTKPVSTAAYFSIDGSHYLEEYNNLSVSSGDLGDWLPSINNDSYGTSGTDSLSAVTPTDLREDNVLGWDRAPATVDDFSGNGVSDILYYNHTTGDVGYYAMNGSLVGWKDIGPSSTTYSVVGTGDFNDDGTADVLFRSSTTGDTGFYAMSNGGEPSGTAATEGNNASGKSTGWVDIGASNTAYSVVGTGRFEVGDGDNNTSDVLFRDNATGDTGFYNIVNGANTGWVDIGASNTAYSVVGVGDFEDDGTSDVLFRDNATGDIGFYDIVNGANTGWVDLGGSNTAYTVVGVADFFGNNFGAADILFRDNATGDFGYYDIALGKNDGWVDLGGSSTAYSIVAVGDYYGNGTDDILFKNNTTGDTGFYSMSDVGANTGWHDIGVSSTAYHVVN
jgi:hypothetical protein